MSKVLSIARYMVSTSTGAQRPRLELVPRHDICMREKEDGEGK